MIRTTHHEGTFAAEIERHECPHCSRWHVVETRHGKTMPEALAGYFTGDCLADDLVIYHESEITADTSGDRDTPPGDDDIETELVRAEVNGHVLPRELAEELFYLFSDRIQEQVAERDL